MNPKEITLVPVACILCGSSEADCEARGYDYEYATVSNRFSFFRCRRCRHLYLNPRPAASDLGVIYPSHYYAFAENQSGNPIVEFFRKRWEGEKVREFRGIAGEGKKKILDVGCGEGRFLSILKEFGSSDWELVGIDFDEKAVARCRERGFRAEAKRIEDFQSEEKFDVVIMFQLIEHVEDPAAVCRQVRRILNPRGIFIVETPNPAGLDYHCFKKSYWGHYHFPRHWNLFTEANLRKMLEEGGFWIKDTRALLAPACWIISIHNFLLDGKYPDWIVRFFYFQNPILLSIFACLDLMRKVMRFPTSNQRIVGQVLG